jgi:hypothetical protein
MRRFISILTIVILSTGFGTAWAGRCQDIANPVWCDDFDNYCCDSWVGSTCTQHAQWPGYPGTGADTKCPDGSAPFEPDPPYSYTDAHFFQNWAYAQEDIDYFTDYPGAGGGVNFLRNQQYVDNDDDGRNDMPFSVFIPRGQREAPSGYSLHCTGDICPDGSPRAGQSCDNDMDCYPCALYPCIGGICSAGPRTGWECANDIGCLGICPAGSPLAGQSCTEDEDCIDCNPPPEQISEYLGTQTSFGMLAGIQNTWSGATAVNGTDANPLHLKVYWSYGGTSAAEQYSPVYSELAMGDDRAPTDYVLATCLASRGPYPMVCQQDPNGGGTGGYPEGCPDRTQHPFQTHAAIAVGLLPFMDNNPCGDYHDHEPLSTTWHVCAFDGLKWRQFVSGIPPMDPECGSNVSDLCGGGTYGVTYGCLGDWDTTVSAGYRAGDPIDKQFYELTIKTNAVKIKHFMTYFRISDSTPICPTMYNGSWESIGTITRYYTGGFTAYRQGIAPGCQLDPTEGGHDAWDCKTGKVREPFGRWIHPEVGGGERGQCTTGDGWSGTNWTNAPVVWGGLPDTGACCLPDLSCEEDKSPSYCEGVSGKFHGGKSCEDAYACCPYPFADTDRDGDVDQMDFAAFQLCYTGTGGGVPPGCECWNRDKDNDVDIDDFTEFNDCWTGPNVPYSVALPPSCSPAWPP